MEVDQSQGISSPKVGLLGFLLEVEGDEGAPQAQGDDSAPHGVDHQHHEQWGVDGVQDAREGDQVDGRVQQGLAQRQRRLRELPAPQSGEGKVLGSLQISRDP